MSNRLIKQTSSIQHNPKFDHGMVQHELSYAAFVYLRLQQMIPLSLDSSLP